MAERLLDQLAIATSDVGGTAFLRTLLRRLMDHFGASGTYVAEARDNGFSVVAA